MSVSYKFSGAGVSGAPVNRNLVMTVDMKVDDAMPKLSKKTDLKVYIEGPSNISNISVLGGDRGKFNIGFTPTVPGVHWVELIFKGTWANEAFRLPISDGPNCPEIAYEGKFRSGAVPLPLTTSASVVGPSAEEEAEKIQKKAAEEEKVKEAQIAKQNKDEEDRKQKEEHDRHKKEEEDRHRREEEARHKEAERKRHEEAERQRKEEEEHKRREVLRAQLEELSNVDLWGEITLSLERLQILTSIQQKRINS